MNRKRLLAGLLIVLSCPTVSIAHARLEAGQSGCAGPVLAAINAARGDPAAFARRLEREPATAARDEAIDFLLSHRSMPPLAPWAALDASADGHAADLGRRSRVSHVGADGSTLRDRTQRAGVWSMMVAEEISLGQDSEFGVAAQLIIDDGVAGAGHRADLFNPLLRNAGVGCAAHPAYGSVVVIDLSGDRLR